MSRAARLWLAVAPAALVAGALALWIILTSDHQDLPRLRATLVLVTGWSFIAAGLIARVRRPLNRTGLLLIAVGFWWLAGSLYASNQSLLWTIGLMIGPVAAAFLVHLLLAYPSGRLVSRWDRAVVTTGYVLTALATLPFLLVERRPIHGCTECPESAFLVNESDTASTFFTVLVETLAVAFLLTVVATLIHRWLRSSPAARRLLTPVMLAGGATLILFAVHVGVMSFSTTVSQVADWAAAFMLLGVPFLFLLGLLKSRLARADISRAVAEEPAGGAQQRVRELLHDPTAELLYACAEPARGYVDAYGRPREPVTEPGRAVTPIEREGRALAAIVHDEALLDEPELLEQVAAAVGLEVERHRYLIDLQATERRSRALLEAIPDSMFRISRDGRILDYRVEPPIRLFRPTEGMIGSNVYDTEFPSEITARTMALGEAALATGEPQMHEYDVEMDGELHHQEARITPSGEDEFLLIVRDVSDRKLQEIQQAALHRVALAVASEARPEQIFDLVSEEIAHVLGAHTTNLVRFEPGLVEGLIVGGWRKPGARAFPIGDRFPLEGTASEAAMKTGRPVRRELDDGDVAAWVSQEMHSLDIHSLVAAPITLTGRPWGAAVATLTAPHSFPPGAEERLSGFTRLVSLALANEEARAELAASRARLVSAGDKERRRLERNLHDGAQQRLVSVSISLRLAEAKLTADPEAGAELLAAASAELAVALEELRELARGIHPAVLTERGLGPALASLAGRAAVRVELESLPEERLPDQVEAAAYYVVSEALANVAKYADASSVSVRVAQEDGWAVVEVVDDGVGGAEPERGSGLRGLADRVESLEGRLGIESPPGEGTTIRAEIPSSQPRAETPAGRMPAGIHP